MLNLSQPIQRRDGTPVEIVATGVREHIGGGTRSSGQTIAARTNDMIRYYNEDGRFFADGRVSPLDLVNVPETTYRAISLDGHRFGSALRALENVAGGDDGWSGFALKLDHVNGNLLGGEVVRVP